MASEDTWKKLKYFKPESIDNAVFQVLQQKDNALTVKINDGHSSNDVLQYFLNQQLNIESFNEILPSLNEISTMEKLRFCCLGFGTGQTIEEKDT